MHCEKSMTRFTITRFRPNSARLLRCERVQIIELTVYVFFVYVYV